MKYYLFILSIFSLMSCGSSGGNSGGGTASESAALDGYVMSSLAGSSGEYAEKRDGAGNLVSSGYVIGEKKNGTWLSYDEEGNRIKTLTSYTDGQLNGPYLEFSNRGQIEKKIEYKAGQYDGMYVKYKFGRPENETPFVNGQKHGTYKEYFQNGKIQKEIEFKNGIQDGKLRYFDEEGNVTLEYDYENGEKVGGGMIEKEG